ncbi:hypothetical protein KR222_003667, partial [Zaprionus bogoriensis]
SAPAQEPIDFERDPACPMSDEPSPDPSHVSDILDIDQPCDKKEVGPVPADNYIYTESDNHDVCLQSRCDTATSPERPYSLDNIDPVPPMEGPLGVCLDYVEQPHVPCIKIESKDSANSRNPITGFGLNGDGVGGLKPKKLKNRGECKPAFPFLGKILLINLYLSINITAEGNPVTGEGYKPGATDFIQPVSLSAGNQVVNKNRVPPGGYSAGLW